MSPASTPSTPTSVPRNVIYAVTSSITGYHTNITCIHSFHSSVWSLQRHLCCNVIDNRITHKRQLHPLLRLVPITSSKTRYHTNVTCIHPFHSSVWSLQRHLSCNVIENRIPPKRHLHPLLPLLRLVPATSFVL